MHRLMRNENDDQINMKGENQCKISGIGKSDLLMLCASYAAQTDLSEFLKHGIREVRHFSIQMILSHITKEE